MADEEGNETTDEVGWNLGRQYSLPGEGVTIDQVREISPGELRQILDARQTLDRFGPMWSHPIAVRLAKDVRASAEELGEAANKAGGLASDAARQRVEGALFAFTEHVEAWIQGTGLQPELDAELLQIRELVEVLAEGAEASEPPTRWQPRPGGGDVLLVRAGDDRWFDALGLVEATLHLSLVFADAELIDAQMSLEAASALLRRVASDAVWGQPILYKWADPDGTFVPDPAGLRLELIDPILRACAIAKRRSTTAPETVADDAPVPPARTGLLKVATEPTTATVVGDEKSAAPSSEGAREPGDIGTLDLRNLFDEALSIASETERRWSAALGGAVQRDVDEFCGRAHSILSSIRGDLGRSESSIRSQGLDPMLPSIPMTAETVGALTFSPSAQQHVTQRGLALMYAAQRVATAMNALQRPSAGRVVDGGRRLEVWWSQGAFVELHAAVAQLGRLLATESGAETDQSAYLALASQAWSAGLTEAAAVYLLRSSNDASSHATLSARSLLVEGCRRIVSGDSYDLEPLALAVESCWEQLRRETRRDGTDGAAE